MNVIDTVLLHMALCTVIVNICCLQFVVDNVSGYIATNKFVNYFITKEYLGYRLAILIVLLHILLLLL